MENNRSRLARTVNVLILALLVLIQILLIRSWYNKTLDDIGINAMTISRVVADSINITEYEKLLAKKEPNDYFREMQAYFQRIQAQTGVKYVYVEHQISPSQIEYIFDSEKDSLGETDELSTPAAHTHTKAFHTRAQTSTLWGTLITGYAPLVNAEGQVIGAVGTDVDIQYIYQELAKRVGQIILYTAAMVVLFGLLIYFTLSEEIRRRRVVEKNLKQSMQSVKNLLNNAGQGFLSFGSDLCIESEYSIECQRLLGSDLDKRNFPDLIYPKDQEQRDFVNKVLLECFQENDLVRREVFLSFLPDAIFLNNYYIKIEYKFIADKRQEETQALMVILTDATEKCALQEQMENERKTLKMIVKAVISRNDLLELISDYQRFCQMTVPQLVICKEPLQRVIVDVKRRIHTFKGEFGQFEMMHMVRSLHHLEEEIKSFEQRDSATSTGLGMLLQNLNLEHVLNEGLRILQSTLGENFIARDKIIEIPEAKLLELEDQIATLIPSQEANILIDKIRKLRYRSFKELLAAYPNTVEGLAQGLEKSLYPLELEGGEFPVDTKRYQAFTKSLIHIFANCVDHGIENREDRIKAGKEEKGRVVCEMKLVQDQILLKIADDGKGLDLEGIKQKALELGVFTAEQLAELDDKDIIPLIFEDGLSSKDSASMISGRGIGMAIVKQELEKIDGHLDIVTNPDTGTEFNFLLPIGTGTHSYD
ncbi:Signal transduction histidine kinase CheA [Dehalobacter sp. UNSWDHB]|uniref:ATP-binding protein n=1 Tax=unclassified Dehalobacter TaxID=2635733 RepID=UPI00028B0A4A|nr:MULTISPECIES: ATP-binding protein [unclassified Dehalobacter]AFV03830.1 Signal transduction histidine kinase CheA [Dehalobacter sp. DCA]AFV06813.1 Signal transduction histidine kinase CheA [Dehalobacter sp. CF]EQB21659.1 Signal transduction histidine kinase CheA [Dehalobacter sp. UNSWDHB]